jgi:hypothetical protein
MKTQNRSNRKALGGLSMDHAIHAFSEILNFSDVFGRVPNTSQLRMSQQEKPDKPFFLSPCLCATLVKAFQITESFIRDNWDDIPLDDRKRFLLFAEHWVKLEQKSIKPKNRLRNFGILSSMFWASFIKRRNFLKELDQSFQNLMDAMLEKVISEQPFNEVEGSTQVVSNRREIKYSSPSKQRPRISKASA